MNTTLLKQEQDRMQKEIDLILEVVLSNRGIIVEPGEGRYRRKVNKKLEDLWQSKQEKTNEKS